MCSREVGRWKLFILLGLRQAPQLYGQKREKNGVRGAGGVVESAGLGLAGCAAQDFSDFAQFSSIDQCAPMEWYFRQTAAVVQVPCIGNKVG